MKKILAMCIGVGMLWSSAPALASSEPDVDYLTYMLNYKYSEDYTVSKKSYKCGDVSNTVSTSNWYLDVDNLDVDGKTTETYMYFNGESYLLTGKFKHNASKGTYKIKLKGGFASEQSDGTATVKVKGTMDDEDPSTINTLKIHIKFHRPEEFTPRTCTAKATVKNMGAYTFLMN